MGIFNDEGLRNPRQGAIRMRNRVDRHRVGDGASARPVSSSPNAMHGAHWSSSAHALHTGMDAREIARIAAKSGLSFQIRANASSLRFPTLRGHWMHG
jgi:hypothetical protein